MRNTLFITNGSTNHRILELCASFSDRLIILGNKKYESEFLYELKQVSKYKNKMRICYANSSLNLFRKSRQLVKSGHINLIVSHCPISSAAALYAKLFKKNKAVFIMCQDFIEYNKESVQNFLSKGLKTFMLHILLSISCRFTKVVALSNHVRKSAERHGAKNVKVIPIYGVNTQVFKKKKTDLRKKYKLENKKVIFTASRLSPEKGLDCLIKALPLIKNKVPNVFLVIAAKGPYKNVLENLVNKLNLQNYVFFTGELPRNELPSYHNMADVFVMPSFKEGLGFNALEAMACLKPVVASNVGGIKDTVIDNKTGLMVKPRDVKGLADAIIRLLKDKKFAESLAENGRKHVTQNFEESLVTRKFTELINQN